MALDYLKSNSIKPVHEKVNVSHRTATRPTKGYFVKLFVLIVAFVITCIFSYHLWMPKIIAKTTTVRSGLTGILHDAQNPSAIINGKIIHLGDSVGRGKIIRIDAGCVTLIKGNNTYQMRLN